MSVYRQHKLDAVHIAEGVNIATREIRIEIELKILSHEQGSRATSRNGETKNAVRFGLQIRFLLLV